MSRGQQGARSMEGWTLASRAPPAITTCTAPAKEEECNAWYKHMHVPDVTAPGIFRYALRFVNTDPSVAAGTYVAT
jgi:hypothetical protein